MNTKIMKAMAVTFLSVVNVFAQSDNELSEVSLYSEYGVLKEVIVGTANTLYFPDSHDIESEQEATWITRFLTNIVYPRFKGKKVPGWIAKKYRNEEDRMIRVLREHQVVIHRPADVMPLPDEPLGLGQMYARDPVISVGNTMFNSNLQIAMRRKENRGFNHLLDKLSDQGITVECPPDEVTFLEGGDVIVDHPYIFVGMGKYATNQKGVDWLKDRVGDTFQVIPVGITDSSVLHLDCALTIIGEKRAIIHRKSLQHPLPEPLACYDFIEVGDKTAKQLGTNVLMLNPQTIIVQKRHEGLIRALREKGYTVIPLRFTWHARLGGAFRCATSPLVRK